MRVAWTLSVLMSLWTTSAVAQPEVTEEDSGTDNAEWSDEIAKNHFNTGKRYYEAGSYSEALREFKRSYELSGRPQLQYNLHLCYERQQEWEQAADALNQYITNTPETSRTSSLRKKLETLQARAKPAVAKPTADHMPEKKPTNVGAIAAFSVAGAALIAGGTFAILASMENSRVGDSACGRVMNCSAEEVSTIKTYALIADIALGVSAAAAVIGLVLLLIRKKPKHTKSLSLNPTVGPAHGGIILHGRF